MNKSEQQGSGVFLRWIAPCLPAGREGGELACLSAGRLGCGNDSRPLLPSYCCAVEALADRSCAVTSRQLEAAIMCEFTKEGRIVSCR
jgi:hypothetical protein